MRAHSRVSHNAIDCVSLHLVRNLPRRNPVKKDGGMIAITFVLANLSRSRVLRLHRNRSCIDHYVCEGDVRTLIRAVAEDKPVAFLGCIFWLVWLRGATCRKRIQASPDRHQRRSPCQSAGGLQQLPSFFVVDSFGPPASGAPPAANAFRLPPTDTSAVAPAKAQVDFSSSRLSL